MTITVYPVAEVAARKANERCGPFLRQEIRVWYCGDDVCNCTQVQVIDVHRHATAGVQAIWPVGLAEGTYCHADDEEEPGIIEQERAEAKRLYPKAVDVTAEMEKEAKRLHG